MLGLFTLVFSKIHCQAAGHGGYLIPRLLRKAYPGGYFVSTGRFPWKKISHQATGFKG